MAQTAILSANRHLGSNQVGLRAFNERQILQLIREHGSLPKAQIARATNLSAQTVSVIINRLNDDGLLRSGAPVKQGVGQPYVPYDLEPEGAFSTGLNVGRRRLDLALIDFAGRVLGRKTLSYDLPHPEDLANLIFTSVEDLHGQLTVAQRKRHLGCGVAAPFSFAGWADNYERPESIVTAWQEIDFPELLRERLDAPLIFLNDVSTACTAELVSGVGHSYPTFIYFYLGTFIGGGLVIDGRVHLGRNDNAGALGSAPVSFGNEHTQQLIDVASQITLERRLAKRGFSLPENKTDTSPAVGLIIDEWLNEAAHAIAFVAASSMALIDADAIILDGAGPKWLIEALCVAVKGAWAALNTEGLANPQILQGSLGAEARCLGGAILPIYQNFSADQGVLFKRAIT